MKYYTIRLRTLFFNIYSDFFIKNKQSFYKYKDKKLNNSIYLINNSLLLTFNITEKKQFEIIINYNDIKYSNLEDKNSKTYLYNIDENIAKQIVEKKEDIDYIINMMKSDFLHYDLFKL